MNSSEGSDSNSKNYSIAGLKIQLKSLLNNFKRFLNLTPKTRPQLMDLLTNAIQTGIISHDAYNMIEGVLQVSDMQVRDIMVPRSQMVVIEKDAKLEECLPRMIESGHSRFPVIGNNRDEVLGSLLAKDLLPYIFRRDETIVLKDLLRPTMVIPESKRLNVLLKEFRAQKQHMAIIADEYGGISGLVTIEDVLEQIVGDIEDEFDTDDENHIVEYKKNIFHVQALTPIEDFNEYFQTHFSEEEFDTIGGLVLNEIGYLPKKNESFTINNLQIKILSADKRRIKLLQIVLPNNLST